jgi:hypothetical protein
MTHDTSTKPSKPPASRRVGYAGVLVATVLVGTGSAYALYGCSSAEPDAPKSAATRPGFTVDPASIEIPKFGKPEEARRYFDAMTEGDRRSLELLDRALAEAKAAPTPDTKYLAELEKDRALRLTRLKVYEEQRTALAAAAK